MTEEVEVGILAALVILAVTWAPASAFGWWFTTIGERDRYPWNWRVLIGPWSYLPWLIDKRSK